MVLAMAATAFGQSQGASMRATNGYGHSASFTGPIGIDSFANGTFFQFTNKTVFQDQLGGQRLQLGAGNDGLYYPDGSPTTFPGFILSPGFADIYPDNTGIAAIDIASQGTGTTTTTLNATNVFVTHTLNATTNNVGTLNVTNKVNLTNFVGSGAAPQGDIVVTDGAGGFTISPFTNGASYGNWVFFAGSVSGSMNVSNKVTGNNFWFGSDGSFAEGTGANLPLAGHPVYVTNASYVLGNSGWATNNSVSIAGGFAFGQGSVAIGGTNWSTFGYLQSASGVTSLGVDAAGTCFIDTTAAGMASNDVANTAIIGADNGIFLSPGLGTNNTVFSQNGFGSRATNTYTMTATGYTNKSAKDIQVFEFTGTTCRYTNINSGFTFSLGSPATTGITFLLKTNCCVVGTGCAAVAMEDAP